VLSTVGPKRPSLEQLVGRSYTQAVAPGDQRPRGSFALSRRSSALVDGWAVTPAGSAHLAKLHPGGIRPDAYAAPPMTLAVHDARSAEGRSWPGDDLIWIFRRAAPCGAYRRGPVIRLCDGTRWLFSTPTTSDRRNLFGGGVP